MTRPVFTILLFLSLLNSATAQQLTHFWTKFIGGDKFDMAHDAVATPDGGIVFTGQTKSNGTGDIPLSFPTDVYVNLVVGKIDSNKQLAWVKVFGGSNEDVGYSICNTADGGFAVLGNTASPDGNVTGFRGMRDLWLLKLNASGNLMWQKTYGSSNSGSLAMSVIQTDDQGFAILGAINGAGDDIPFHYGSSFDLDWFVLKTDNLGNKQWAQTVGGSKDEDYRGNILEVNDGYFIVGSSASSDHDCFDTSWHPSSVATQGDFYLVKLNKSGTVQWQRSYGGTLPDGPARGILDPRDSSILLVGTSVSFDYMVPKTTIGGVTWLVKVDKKDGKVTWTKILGDGLSHSGDGIILTSDGYIVCTRVAGDIYDAGIYVVDTAGDKIIETKLGGKESDIPRALISYKGYAAIIGHSGSPQFTTGANLNSVNGGGDVFISTMGYWKTNITDINKENNSLNVFPNPAGNIVNITFSGKQRQKGSMTVHDSAGKIIYRKKTKPGADSITVETGQWPPGTYIVQWQEEEGQTLHAKFIRN